MAVICYQECQFVFMRSGKYVCSRYNPGTGESDQGAGVPVVVSTLRRSSPQRVKFQGQYEHLAVSQVRRVSRQESSSSMTGCKGIKNWEIPERVVVGLCISRGEGDRYGVAGNQEPVDLGIC